MNGSNGAGNCGSTVLFYNSGANQSTLNLPPTGPMVLRQPRPPTGLSVAANGDGTRTLTWTAPTGSPTVDFYRIYRDGQNYKMQFDYGDATYFGDYHHPYKITEHGQLDRTTMRSSRAIR